MPDYVRVRAQNGSEISMIRRSAEAAGLKELKKPATGRDGRPLPPKHRVPLGKAAAANPTSEADASEVQED